ncbi:TPA: hypothetical protein HA265_00470 [Candidatus Woesearchaeota archaeon]|nr:hypothetical protein [Candidatus Woesearchaeota archaeon]
MKIHIISIILLAIVLTGCQQKPIGGDRDENGCLAPAGYSWDNDVGACTRSWELDAHEKEVAKTVLVVQSYSSFTIVSVEKIENCEDCYDVTLQRNPIDEETKKEIYLKPYVVPYREGRIDHSYDDKITGFDECIAAGYPVMESYPRQCRAGDTTFTEAATIFCTDEQRQAEGCDMEYNPVCGEILLNTGETTYMTFDDSCSACSAMKSIAYSPGICEDRLFVICKETITGFDPKEYAQSNNGICVEKCPEAFDTFTTQTGIQVCIPHYGETEIEQWPTCDKSTETCKCARAYETTDEKQIDDAKYRCVPEKYSERLLFRGGLDSLDEQGEQSVMIA